MIESLRHSPVIFDAKAARAASFVQTFRCSISAVVEIRLFRLRVNTAQPDLFGAEVETGDRLGLRGQVRRVALETRDRLRSNMGKHSVSRCERRGVNLRGRSAAPQNEALEKRWKERKKSRRSAAKSLKSFGRANLCALPGKPEPAASAAGLAIRRPLPCAAAAPWPSLRRGASWRRRRWSRSRL
jgi:hypothetical protein